MKLMLCLGLVFLFSLNILADRSIVFLKDSRSNYDKLKRDLSNRGTIIRQMKENSDNSLKRFLDESSKIRDVRIGKALWSINAVIVEGTKIGIDKLSDFSTVREILPDSIEYPANTVETTNPDIENNDDEYTYGLKNLNVPKVWKELGIKGKGTLVGIIDTGLDGNHPEFKGTGKVVKFWANDYTSTIDNMTDSHGHGSHVAGTIAGGKLSGKYIGIAPECKLIIAKGISSKGTRASYLLEAMQWMIDPDGDPDTNDNPRVVNCSWTSGYTDQNPYYDMIKKWVEVGICPSFSAGNSGPKESTITKPKEYPLCFASAAVDKNKRIARFSSRGPGIYKGQKTNKPDWATPGVDVYSVKAGGGYRTMSGTSMASPHTTGTIALILSANPDLTVEDVREILKQSSSDAGDSGYDYTYGNGVLNAYVAVKLALEGGFVTGKVSSFSGTVKNSYITVKETGRKIYSNEKGEFRMMLAAGKYTLLASAYGYITKEETVYITPNQTVNADFSLSEASKIRISGKVVSKDSNDPVKATIKITNIEGLKVETDNEGNFEFNVVSGKYSFSITAFGYKMKNINEKDYNYSKDITIKLDPLPPIMIIDDDKGKNFEKYFTDVLDELNVEYSVFDANSNTVTEAQIMPYNIVIWMTGSSTSDTISKNDRELLTKYLKSGGSFFATGQDIGYNIKKYDFYKNYMHAEFVKDAAKTRKVFGNGFNFNISGLNGANNQKYPDIIKTAKNGKELFKYSDGEGTAAISYKGDYKMIYFGFGFEAISTPSKRKDIMEYVIEFLMPNMKDQLERLTKLENMNYKNNELKYNIISSYEDLIANEINNLPLNEVEELLNSRIEFDNDIIREAILNRTVNQK